MKKKTTTKEKAKISRQITAEDIRTSAMNHLKYTIGKDSYSATQRDKYASYANALRDKIIEKWLETHRRYHDLDTKRVYYLSMEFLIGKIFENSLINMGLMEKFEKAISSEGGELNELIDLEDEAGLGNGGLGRLAACFLDSMATMGIPGYGYGIRFEYGMFSQKIQGTEQIEQPDNWLRYGNTWEFARPEFMYPVRFYGRVNEFIDDEGRLHHEWTDGEMIMAMAYDIPIPGFKCKSVNNLRLWAAKASRDFDLTDFNRGDYLGSVEQKNSAENISKILYPNDASESGRILRLKQEYMLVSATLQDIFRRYKKHHDDFSKFSDKVALQMNDTHPTMAVPELMRILMDIEGLNWDEAWEITTKTVNYTNHTVLPEALEKWPVDLMTHLFPRHMQIIYEINHRFLNSIAHHAVEDPDIQRRTSIIEEGPVRRVRMAHLAIIGSYKVNGVAAIHSQILKDRLFKDFYLICPEKFTNKTNGISQRAWLKKPNKRISNLITKQIGPGWTTDLYKLQELRKLTNDSAFREKWRAVKFANKTALAGYIKQKTGIEVDPNSLFDVHVKRIHEYKRQMLNILNIVTLYNRIRSGASKNPVPRTAIFAGKAAPGYRLAKDIIALINSIGATINTDDITSKYLKVVFIPNYNVTSAEVIIPGADLSQQISTAGTEASGTGCMKLALNGALTICTLDGANIEMQEEMGEDNIFVFGKTAAQVEEIKRNGYNSWEIYNSNAELKEAINMILDGAFSRDNPGRFREVIKSLLEYGDNYLVCADYADYVACQERVSALYSDKDAWTKKSIISTASMGKFSSDRTISEYADEIWRVR